MLDSDNIFPFNCYISPLHNLNDVFTHDLLNTETHCAQLGKKPVSYVPSAQSNKLGGGISSIFFNATGKAAGGPLSSTKRTVTGSADILFIYPSALQHARLRVILVTNFGANSCRHATTAPYRQHCRL